MRLEPEKKESLSPVFKHSGEVERFPVTPGAMESIQKLLAGEHISEKTAARYFVEKSEPRLVK